MKRDALERSRRKSGHNTRSKASVALETYGCTLNHADSDIMQGILEKAGYEISEDATIFILNTCAVKETTENKLIFRLGKLHSAGKKIVVAGCLGMKPNQKRVWEAAPNAVIVLPDAVSQILEAVLAAQKGEVKVFSHGEDKGSLHRIYTAPILRIPAQDGCVGSCNFCQTKIARPKLKSLTIRQIKRWVEEGVQKGAKEIQITGQDTGAYGMDIGTGLPTMLNEILSIDGDFMIRLGMINPAHAKRFLPELLKILENPKFYRFLHIPVQTGSETVREDMDRLHTVSDFEYVVEQLREKFPDLTLSTDVIVGYPTESSEDYEKTKELLLRISPDVVNISKYSSRRGTGASLMKKIPTQEVKRRSRELSEIVHELTKKRNSRYVGQEVRVLITELQKTPTGRMCNYKQVCIDSDLELGKWVRAKIIDYNHGSLFGKLA